VKRTWDFTITLEMSDKAVHKLWDWSDGSEREGRILPEWEAAKQVEKWLRKRGVKARLLTWQWGNPQPPKDIARDGYVMERSVNPRLRVPI